MKDLEIIMYKYSFQKSSVETEMQVKERKWHKDAWLYLYIR